jgi:hypothetical protein
MVYVNLLCSQFFLADLASFFVSSNFGAPLLTKKLAKSAKKNCEQS